MVRANLNGLTRYAKPTFRAKSAVSGEGAAGPRDPVRLRLHLYLASNCQCYTVIALEAALSYKSNVPFNVGTSACHRQAGHSGSSRAILTVDTAEGRGSDRFQVSLTRVGMTEIGGRSRPTICRNLITPQWLGNTATGLSRCTTNYATDCAARFDRKRGNDCFRRLL